MKKLLAALTAVIVVLLAGGVAAVPLVEQHAARLLKSRIEADGLVAVEQVSVGLFERRIELVNIRSRGADGYSAAFWSASGLAWPLTEIVRGRLPLEGLKIGDPIKAAHIEVRDFGLSDVSGNSWKFGHVSIEDIELARYDSDAGPGRYGLTVIGARALAALSVRKLEERDVTFTVAGSTDGFAAASLSLENLERGRIGALSVADFRVTSPRSQEPVFSVADTRFAGLDGGKMLAAMSVASWMPGMPVGRLGLDKASASGFGGELLTRFGISLEGITADFDHSTPKLMRGRTRISNFVLAPPLRGLEALQIRLAMTAMGLREARLDFDCSGTEDRSRRELAIDRCALTGRDLAEVDFTMKVVDADETFWRALDEGDVSNLYSSRAAIGTARLTLADRSLIERAFRAIAAMSGQPAPTLRNQFAQEIRRFQPADVLITEDLTKLLDTVARFVEQGGTLVVEAKPDPPFALERVGYLMTPGPDLVTSLGISARLLQ